MAHVLGLDLGRNSAFALAGPEYLAGWRPRSRLEGPRASNNGLIYAPWPLGKHASHDALYGNLWERLSEQHAKTPLDLVAYESAGTRFESAAAIWIVCGLVVVTKTWCRMHGVTEHLIHNGRVKKHATGSGRAEKKDIIEAAESMGWEPQTDDVADALFVLDMCLSEWQRR